MLKENQIMPKVITMKGILRYMASKWIPVLLIMVLCGCIFGAKGVIDQKKKVEKQAGQTEKEVSVTIDETGFLNVKAIAENEDIIAEKQKYLDESILMHIEPTAKWNANIRYRFTFDAEQRPLQNAADESDQEQQTQDASEAVDYEALRQKLAMAYYFEFRKQETIDRIKELAGIDSQVSYLNEIIGFEATGVPGTFYVWGVQSDREKMDALMGAVETIVGEWKDLGTDIGGKYTVTMDKIESFQNVDTGLADSQNAKKNDLVNLQTALATKKSQLTDEEAAYLEVYRSAREQEDYTDGMPIKKTEPVKAVSKDYKKVLVTEGGKGLLAGLGISFVLAFLLYLLSPVLLSEDSVKDMYQIPVFARVKKRGQYDTACNFMKELIAGRSREKKAALLSSSDMLMQGAAINMLSDKLKDIGTEFVMVSDISLKAEAVKSLCMAEDVYLIERVGKSRHRDIEKELLLCSELGLRVAGVFLV